MNKEFHKKAVTQGLYDLFLEVEAKAELWRVTGSYPEILDVYDRLCASIDRYSDSKGDE